MCQVPETNVAYSHIVVFFLGVRFAILGTN